MARMLTLAVVILLLVAVPARADLGEGYDALDRGDYEAALRIFGELAAANDADALYALGTMHADGLGVPADHRLAAEHFRRAAELGHAGGQVAIGYASDFALGVPHDPAQAERWYAKAMASGSITAMNNLAYSWAERNVRLDEAQPLIKRVLAVEPDNSSYLDTLGWILFKQGRYETSVIPLCRASVLEPGHPEVAIHFGDALWMIGQFARARAQWQRALDLSADPAALSRAGRDYMGIQDESWTADLRGRLANGLADLTIPTPVEMPRDCADLTS